MNTLSADFRAPLFLRSGHLQTMLGVFAGNLPQLSNTVKHKIPLPQGGFTFGYDDCPSGWNPDNAAILLLHGLGGSHNSGYMRRIADRLHRMGHRTLRLDLPGSGTSSELTDMPAHAGCSREVAAVLDWALQKLQINQWRLVGVSMGGNIILKLLGEIGLRQRLIDDCEATLLDAQDQELWKSLGCEARSRSKRITSLSECDTHKSPDPDSLSGPAVFFEQFHRTQSSQLIGIKIVQAVIVAPPIDLQTCCNSMSRGVNRIYTRYFLKSLRKQVEHRSKTWESWRAIPSKPVPKTIEDFDRRYTAPLAGFSNVSDYYTQSSSQFLLPWIQTPMRILIDRHDPIVPTSIFERSRWSPSTTVTQSSYGGHLGYRYGRSQDGMYWLDEWVVKEVLEESY